MRDLHNLAMQLISQIRALLLIATVASAEDAGQRIDITLASDFKAPPANVSAVLSSAAESIWRHCPSTRWQTPGFEVFLSPDYPIAAFDHRANGRIAIGVTTTGTYWSQYAFQFSHEFAHALAGHANDWRKPWIREKRANHWLEESICETASLFALRAMAESWRTHPPYPNWRDYAQSLRNYADDRLRETERTLPADANFIRWLAANESSMRSNSVQREKNNVVARHLLPVFERTPSGWEAVTFLNLGKRRDPNLTLSQHLADWREAAPPKHRAFIEEVARTLGARL